MTPLPQTLRRPIAAGEVTDHFFLVGIPAAPHSNAMARYVRKDASPEEEDPWVRVSGPASRSAEVHRFRTEAEGKTWAARRKEVKGTKCRVVACKGPVREP